MTRRWRDAAVGGVIAAGLCVAACAAPREPSGFTAQCEARVIVGFVDTLDADAMAAVAAASATRLTVVERLLPNLYVLDLAATATSCSTALERLRADGRVRSADLDQRRAPNDAR